MFVQIIHSADRYYSPKTVYAHVLFCPFDSQARRHVLDCRLRRVVRCLKLRFFLLIHRLVLSVKFMYLRCVDDLHGGLSSISISQLSFSINRRLALALILEIRIIEPPPCGIIRFAASRAVKNTPCTLTSYNCFIRSVGYLEQMSRTESIKRRMAYTRAG